MIGFLYSLACNSSHHHLPAVPDVDAWCGWTAVQTHALQVVPVAIARCYVGQSVSIPSVTPSMHFRLRVDGPCTDAGRVRYALLAATVVFDSTRSNWSPRST